MGCFGEVYSYKTLKKFFWTYFFSSTLSMTLLFQSKSVDLFMPCLLHHVSNVSIKLLRFSVMVDLPFPDEILWFNISLGIYILHIYLYNLYIHIYHIYIPRYTQLSIQKINYFLKVIWLMCLSIYHIYIFNENK